MGGKWVVVVEEGGRVQVPPEVWETLGVGPGDRVWLEIEDGLVVMRVAPEGVGESPARYEARPAEGKVSLTVTLTEAEYRLLLAEADARGRRPEEVVADLVRASTLHEMGSVEDRLAAVERLRRMALPVADWEQMEKESTPGRAALDQQRISRQDPVSKLFGTIADADTDVSERVDETVYGSA